MKTQRIEQIEVNMEELESIVERARRERLGEEEHRKLKAALETLGFLTQELESKNVSLKRLRSLLFGSQTEKLENVLPVTDREARERPSRTGEGGSGQHRQRRRASRRWRRS